MHVVIVESPAKCKTINKYLGKDYQVLASFGHVRDLPSKNGSVRPDENFAMDYQIQEGSGKHINAIASAVKNADSLILATDPDREGEAISWHVLETLKQKKALKAGVQIKRVVFYSITRDAVLEAMEHPRDIDMNLVNAQQARRALDYLVGFTLSPVLWRKLPGSRSAGRVQSVALRLICDREQEIEAFKPQEYWTVEGAFLTSKQEPFTARLTHIAGKKLDKFDLGNDAAANNIVTTLQSKNYVVGDVEKKQVKRHPAPPFTTSTLQQEAFRKLGFGAKKTMQLAQKLYEGIDVGGEQTGLITYMRTDAVNLSGEAIGKCRATIEGEFGAKYVPEKPRVYASKSKNAQEAHEAIRPTSPGRMPASLKARLDNDMLRLYELIWKRTIASQMESALFDKVAADIQASDGSATLRANGSTVLFDGFLKLYFEDTDDVQESEDDGRLPPLATQDNVALNSITPSQHFTEPPPRFSEASLVKRLEELGIGRPSTYASIISILQERGYVLLEKKRFTPEPRGRVVTAFLNSFFHHYVEYDFTADLEEELDRIANGELDWKLVLGNFWKDFSATVSGTEKLEISDVIRELNQSLERLLFPGEGDIEARRKCPSCDNGRISLKMGKFGPFIGCSSYPECTYTRKLNIETEDNGDVKEEFQTRLLGNDENGEEITVRKGPYGFYVQRGAGKKPKRTSLPKGHDATTLTLEMALSLLNLPREIGTHPETGKKITANIGRFGPYLYHDGVYTSLKGEDDLLTIGMNRAVALIAEQGAKGKKKIEPLRVLGQHPESGKDVAVFEGRYGPYIKHERVNASIPKSQTVEGVTLEEALALLEARGKKPGKSGKRKKK